jgi:hypothetical protein
MEVTDQIIAPTVVHTLEPITILIFTGPWRNKLRKLVNYYRFQLATQLPTMPM